MHKYTKDPIIKTIIVRNIGKLPSHKASCRHVLPWYERGEEP